MEKKLRRYSIIGVEDAYGDGWCVFDRHNFKVIDDEFYYEKHDARKAAIKLSIVDRHGMVIE